MSNKESEVVMANELIIATEGGFTVFNLKTGTPSQGATVEEAVVNLREATELYLEEFSLNVNGQPLITTFHVTTHA